MTSITEATYTLAQAIAPSVEVLAIGDIHGEAGLLEALLSHAALPAAAWTSRAGVHR